MNIKYLLVMTRLIGYIKINNLLSLIKDTLQNTWAIQQNFLINNVNTFSQFVIWFNIIFIISYHFNLKYFYQLFFIWIQKVFFIHLVLLILGWLNKRIWLEFWTGLYRITRKKWRTFLQLCTDIILAYA